MVATKACFIVVGLIKSSYVKHAPVMPKMALKRGALHNVLAQGASNRDITVYHKVYLWPREKLVAGLPYTINIMSADDLKP